MLENEINGKKLEQMSFSDLVTTYDLSVGSATRIFKQVTPHRNSRKRSSSFRASRASGSSHEPANETEEFKLIRRKLNLEEKKEQRMSKMLDGFPGNASNMNEVIFL